MQKALTYVASTSKKSISIGNLYLLIYFNHKFLAIRQCLACANHVGLPGVDFLPIKTHRIMMIVTIMTPIIIRMAVDTFSQ